MRGHNRPPFPPKIPGTDLPSWDVPTAIIYRPARSAMTSAPLPNYWVLEFEPSRPPQIEPLMGYTSSGDPYRPIRLKFPDHDRRCGLRLAVEHARCPIEELIAPLRDLVRMHVELLRQLDDRLLAPHGCKGHLRLEGRRMVPPRSFRHGLSCRGHHAAFRQKLHLSDLSKFPEPALTWPSSYTASPR